MSSVAYDIRLPAGDNSIFELMCENQAVEYYLNTAITNIFVSATVRTVPGALCFRAVCACVRDRAPKVY